jgi:hypothetical protein
MMQKKLDETQLASVVAARNAIGVLPAGVLVEGVEYWCDVHKKLNAMAKHGTSDGKPWVEPPLTDEDAKQRPWVMVRDTSSQPWRGPKVLVYVEKNAAGPREYLDIGPREYLDTAGVWWHYARKAKAEEIPARKATQ